MPLSGELAAMLPRAIGEAAAGVYAARKRKRFVHCSRSSESGRVPAADELLIGA
jgi:hypothetical protein